MDRDLIYSSDSTLSDCLIEFDVSSNDIEICAIDERTLFGEERKTISVGVFFSRISAMIFSQVMSHRPICDT